MTLRSLALLPVVLLLIAACAAAPAPSAAPASPGAGAPASATPSSAPSSAPGPVVSPTPVTSQAPSPIPSAAIPSAPPLSASEKQLLDQLRIDARVACGPRRADLPAGAVAGVECRIGSSLVDRVGIYGFGGESGATGDGTALGAYLARLASAGVQRGSGSCATGSPGDASWPANLPDEGEDGGPRAERAGCYLDPNGSANVRVTCYGDIYVGVLGTNGDLAALNAWTWKVAEGESVHRDPPGICAAPD